MNLSPILRWCGGKTRLRKTLLAHVPQHETYVEPFIGGGSLYFAKNPAKKEVIADKNKKLVNFYNRFKNVNCNNNIGRCNLPTTKQDYFRVRDKKDPTVCEFLGTNKRSYGGKHESFNPANAERGKISGIVNVRKNCEKYKERLKKTVILNKGFDATIRQYDSPNSFIYIDPPYPETFAYGLPKVTPEEVLNAVKGIKGKFLLSYKDTPEIKRLFSRYHIKRVKTTYQLQKSTQKRMGQEVKEKP